MATLETQYKNYMEQNPRSSFTFDQWKHYLSFKLSEGLQCYKDNVVSKDLYEIIPISDGPTKIQ
jgi:hypothetical protein